MGLGARHWSPLWVETEGGGGAAKEAQHGQGREEEEAMGKHDGAY